MYRKRSTKRLKCPQCKETVIVDVDITDVEMMKVFKRDHPSCYMNVLLRWNRIMDRTKTNRK